LTPPPCCMSVIERGGEHQPPEYIERKVCGECGIVPPYCDHDRAKLLVERYVPEQQLQGAVKALEACRAQAKQHKDAYLAMREENGILRQLLAGGQ
jgi:hypothetical protein